WFSSETTAASSSSQGASSAGFAVAAVNAALKRSSAGSDATVNGSVFSTGTTFTAMDDDSFSGHVESAVACQLLRHHERDRGRFFADEARRRRAVEDGPPRRRTKCSSQYSDNIRNGRDVWGTHRPAP